MSPVQCFDCGLLDKDTGSRKCVALKRPITSQEMNQYWLCYYYLPVIKEDGCPLTPFEHFLLKKDEIDRKK